MMVIGLTGGIASGKSTVAAMLRNANIPVIDADDLAREATKVGSPGLTEVVAAFGRDILRADQSLDRAKLATIVFADEHRLRQLEAILHPKIEQLFNREMQQLESFGHPIVVYMAPLLFEKQIHRKLAKTLLVVANDDLRKTRLVARDQLTREDAEKRFKAQLTDDCKIKLADEIIENNGSMDELYNNLCQAFERVTKTKLVLAK